MKPLWAVAGVALLGAAGAGTLTAAYVILPRDEEVGFGDSDARAVSSADFVVNTTVDAVDAAPGDGICATAEAACSLRAAVQETNALPYAQSVEVPAGTYTLTLTDGGDGGGDLDITGDLTVTGGGSAETILDANHTDRAFEVPQGDNVSVQETALTIRGITITNGSAGGQLAEGGGIYNAGHLTLEDVDILGNVAAFAGGGLANIGNATLKNSKIRENSSPNGGAVGNSLGGPGNRLALIDSIVASNRDDLGGSRGGIFAPTSDVQIVRSSIVNNLGVGVSVSNFRELTIDASTVANNVNEGRSGEGAGAGIVAQGTVSITNSTISGNAAKDHGGGILGDGSLRMSSVTLVNNIADANGDGQGNGGGIYWTDGPVWTGTTEAPSRQEIANSIIAGNIDRGGESWPDCFGAVTSLGHNLIETPTCVNPVEGDIIGEQALIGPLADNGRPTQTHALLEGSPAIDTGNPAAPGSGSGACEAADQRGVLRPQGARCDIGAFELEVAEPSVTQTPAPITPSPVVIPNPAAEWTDYLSEKWGYRISYPPGWYDLPNFGAPDEQKYFSNQPVRAPLEMNESGVWMTISVSSLVGDDCATASLYSGLIEESSDLVIAGRRVARHLVHNTSVEGGPRVVLNLETNGACYTFYVITFSDQTRSDLLPVIDQAMESFRPPWV